MPREPGKARPRRWARLGARIRELRVRAGYATQDDLAARTNLSVGYISNVENGYSQVSTDVLERLAEVLDADFNELSVLAGYMKPLPDDAWAPPPDKRKPLRWMSEHLPLEKLEWLERLARMGLLEGVPPSQKPDEQREHEQAADDPDAQP